MRFYNYRNIDKTGATYRLIIGERSNGKTYGFLKKTLEAKIKTGRPSAYIRRFDTETKASVIKWLYNSVMTGGDFDKIVKGKFDDIYYYGGVFYLRKLDDKCKVVEQTPLLFVYALNTWETYKGADHGEVEYVCFDEFCTRRRYLNDEFIILQQILSSIIRNRAGVVVYLLANTVNKVCPHFDEFGIGDVDDIKQGSIVDFKNGVAIEYCAATGNSSKLEYLTPFKNVQLGMLKSGSWELKQYPHLAKWARHDDILLMCYVRYAHKIVCGEVRQNKSGGLYLFWYFHSKPIDDDNIIYDIEPSAHYLHSQHLIKYQPTKAHKMIYELVRSDKMFYKSNEVGEVVRNWLQRQGFAV